MWSRFKYSLSIKSMALFFLFFRNIRSRKLPLHLASIIAQKSSLPNIPESLVPIVLVDSIATSLLIAQNLNKLYILHDLNYNLWECLVIQLHNKKKKIAYLSIVTRDTNCSKYILSGRNNQKQIVFLWIHCVVILIPFPDFGEMFTSSANGFTFLSFRGHNSEVFAIFGIILLPFISVFLPK